MRGSNVRKVTLWSVVDKGRAEFNHLEFGHVEQPFPTANTSGQAKAWANQEWVRKYAYLDDDNVVCLP